MPSIKRTILLLFVLTLGVFAAVWIFYIKQGQKLDTSTLHLRPLRVLAYPTFVSVYGPGPELAKIFEQRCQCKVELLNAGDSALFIEKLTAKGGEYIVDVVVGLDQLLIEDALQKIKWNEIEVTEFDIDKNLILEGQNFLVPFDWAPLTFMYKKSEIAPPTSLKDLLDPRFKGTVSLQNPLTSTPGRQFYSWVFESMGATAGLNFFDQLRGQKFLFADNWSASYGLFQKGPMKLSFTYLTSAIFHWETEKNLDFQPAVFEEPHPIQVEYAGVPANCHMCKEGSDFIKFLLEPGSQSLIMQKNYMYPAVVSVIKGSAFEKLPQVKTLGVKTQMTNDWLKEALNKAEE